MRYHVTAAPSQEFGTPPTVELQGGAVRLVWRDLGVDRTMTPEQTRDFVGQLLRLVEGGGLSAHRERQVRDLVGRLWEASMAAEAA